MASAGTSRPDFYRNALRHRWLTIVLAALLGVLAGAAAVLTDNQQYRSTAVVFLQPLVGNPYSPTTPETRQEQLAALTTEAGLVLSDAVVRQAREDAAADGTELGEDAPQRTTTEVPSNSQVVRISFAAPDPVGAQVGAQALAESYLEYRQERAAEIVGEQVVRLDEQIDSLEALQEETSTELATALGTSDPAAPSADVVNLQEQVRIYAGQLGQLRIERSNAESTALTAGEIISPAVQPEEPEGIPPLLIGLGLAVSLLVGGLILALVQEHLDTRVRTADDLADLDVPVLGPVPASSTTGRADEEYQVVRNALRLGTGAREVRCVVGAGPDVATLEPALGLASAAGAAGRSVVLVLAGPAVPAELSGPGLSDVLAGAVTADAAVRGVGPQVQVLPSGPDPEALAHPVQQPAFAELVRGLAARHDLVLLVGPSAHSATGSALARVADGTVVVAATGLTREPEVVEAARLLTEVGARWDGVLLVAPPRRSRRGGAPAGPPLTGAHEGGPGGGWQPVGAAGPAGERGAAGGLPGDGEPSRSGDRPDGAGPSAAGAEPGAAVPRAAGERPDVGGSGPDGGEPGAAETSAAGTGHGR
ncbi:hypothetical protein MF406_04790 [Georgenia sp. TF02-10]|uniref:hypothetical protein n=1 Tax=Georgenia sp. TF02-10 TaxID=2917725 RepID=UPI001FA7F5DD|nr:hypothetical protein [Georgenia sp. TF02-10]UNX55581.1 hypothetical protein MF406_04790 [Georgenia sp. TF02-10]